MTKIKNILSILISLVVLIALLLNVDVIVDKLKTLFNPTPAIEIKPGNDYVKMDEFKFVQQSTDYIPYNYQDLLNIFYSTLNQGWEDFTFYCPVEYEKCLDDVAKISLDEALLSDINNYVHPYNSYTTIKTLYDDSGKVKILVTHLYSQEEIDEIEKYVNDLFKKKIKDSMSVEQKIRVLHDYVINNTFYDTVRAKTDTSQYDSARMTGLIKEHYAICSGYADIMAVFLYRLGIPNFKVSSNNHIWNAVLVNNKWLHLDLTWDDPITSNGRNILDHSYFLINSNKLASITKDSHDHDFNKNIYKELDY